MTTALPAQRRLRTFTLAYYYGDGRYLWRSDRTGYIYHYDRYEGWWYYADGKWHLTKRDVVDSTDGEVFIRVAEIQGKTSRFDRPFFLIGTPGRR